MFSCELSPVALDNCAVKISHILWEVCNAFAWSLSTCTSKFALSPTHILLVACKSACTRQPSLYTSSSPRPGSAERTRRQEAVRAALALAVAEEEAMALRIEAEVRARVDAALASPEVQARIEARLREERAALEQKVRRLWG